jgi:hypothetical protein
MLNELFWRIVLDSPYITCNQREKRHVSRLHHKQILAKVNRSGFHLGSDVSASTLSISPQYETWSARASTPEPPHDHRPRHTYKLADAFTITTAPPSQADLLNKPNTLARLYNSQDSTTVEGITSSSKAVYLPSVKQKHPRFADSTEPPAGTASLG